MTLIAIGPLTNLALARRRDPARFSEVHQIIIMGGAVSVPGNVTLAAEFNFYVDPEAAREMLTSDVPVTLIPLDVTRRAVLSAEAIRTLGRQGGEAGRFIEAFSRVGLAFAQRVEKERGITLHDPLAVAAAVAEELFTFESLALDVETADEATRGKVLVAGRSGHPHCRVATEVRAEEFLDLFMERLCPGSSSSAARI
jgi:purine nucleosidase/pyrimidine-specific ribonucleoside hydrolase